jgi:hypothetical protein
MCRVTMCQSFVHQISAVSLQKRMGVFSIEYCLASRTTLGWSRRTHAQEPATKKAHAFVGTRTEDRICQEMTCGRSLERHLKHFGLVDDGGKAISFSEWATLAQDRAGWLKLVTKVPFDIGKPQLRPPRCDTRVTPEEKRRFLRQARPREGATARPLQRRSRRRRDLRLAPNLCHEQFPL